jgi:hypothetical protein
MAMIIIHSYVNIDYFLVSLYATNVQVYSNFPGNNLR